MNPLKHTPGPWKLDDGADLRIVGGPYKVPHLVADIPRTLRPGDESAVANARLIAAAPKLLDHLKAALDDLEQRCDEAPCPTVEAGRKIIAKAEGRGAQ